MAKKIKVKYGDAKMKMTLVELADFIINYGIKSVKLK